ncbi:MAG TPA: GNAT family N-acetyltransferase [Flexivirga sp.]|uniref:GNAT family N-acetyltransferase n=1 Tax=Flexivirga sp. TaxID=1962927 RepID=UPI002BF901F0|nr:GNAT family N-acetyltransferase [Flexivirga sp.]HWC21477.1 GNAT family N-acetyltransferase [Flexivirga sp.]
MPSESVSQSHLTDLLVVGRRVVLRSRLAPGDSVPGGPTLTDTLGDVVSVTDSEVVVDTRNGPVTVDRSSIVLAKRVPPPPPRRAPRRPTPSRVTASSAGDGPISPSVGEEAVTREELEALMVGGMPPLESVRIGDWLLRAANGYTGRANSVLPLGDPGMPLESAVDQVIAWYAERDQPALVQLPHETGADPRTSDLGALLAQRDWRFFQSTLVMTLPPRVTASSPSDGPISPSLGEEAVTRDRVRVEVATAPTDDWWTTGSPRALEHRSTLADLLTHVQHPAYLTAYLDDRPVGHARLAFTDGWSGIFDIHTDPAVRRRGIATALMAAATQAADEQRISLQYLQVSADNVAAVGLYRSLGWQVHHEYHYATPHAE